MLKLLTSTEVQGIFRHLLTIGAGYLVQHDLATKDQANALLAGLVAAAAVIWSFVDKANARQREAVALATPTAVAVVQTAPAQAQG